VKWGDLFADCSTAEKLFDRFQLSVCIGRRGINAGDYGEEPVFRLVLAVLQKSPGFVILAKFRNEKKCHLLHFQAFNKALDGKWSARKYARRCL
jgi:hypothetical protein